MIERSEVEGFLLAGGESRRMGSPKALLSFGDKSLPALVARIVAPCVHRLTVVTDRPNEVRSLELPVITDIYKNAGPLGGLHAALVACQTKAVFLAAIDLPFLSGSLMLELLRRHGAAPTTVPRTRDGLHPLCAVFDRTIIAEVERRLEAGELSVRKLVEHVGVEIVDLSLCRPPIDPIALANVNTPEDLAEARSRFDR